MALTELAGAPGVRVSNWNNVIITAVNTDFSFADGGATFLTNHLGNLVNGMTLMMNMGNGGGQRTDGNNGANDIRMITSHIDKYEANPEGRIAAFGVPYAKYSIYFYVYPDTGGGLNNERGGYFTITNSLDPTDFQTRWLKGGVNGTIPLPDADGNGWVMSTTSVQPSTWANIQAGHYVVIPNLTNADFEVRFAAVGGGAGGIPGGNSARRLKFAGFQIVEQPSTTLTNLSLESAVPQLLTGNSTATKLVVLGNFSDGTVFPVGSLGGVTYSSDNTNIFTVGSDGGLMPGIAGAANLVIGYGGMFLTNSITVVAPIAVRPSITPTPLFLGTGGADIVQARLIADFASVSNVDVTTFSYMAFSNVSPAVATVSAGGWVTPVGIGTFNLSATYAGVTGTLAPAGTVAWFAAPTSVGVISVDISDAANIANFKDESGAPGARAAYWNGLAFTGGSPSNQISAPKDSRGNIMSNTVITVTGRGQNSGTAGTLTTNESRIFRTYYDAGLNTPASTVSQEGLIQVSNIPYSIYDAYFYCFNDTGALNRPGHFTVLETGETRWRNNAATLPGGTGNNIPNEATGGGYLEALPLIEGGSIPNGILPSVLASVPAGNFVRFTGLTNRDLVVSWGADGLDNVTDASTTTRLRLVGFQIVKNLANLTPTNVYLPEPVPGLLPGNPAGLSLTVLADFTDGTTGGNITSLAHYSSADANLFTVDTNGVVMAGLVPGTANLIVSFKTLSVTQAVTVLAPTALRVVATPDTVYLDGVLGVGSAQASIRADFPGRSNVNVTAFTGVTFNDLDPAVASVSTTGAITAVNYGKADLGATYLGVSSTHVDVFNVFSITNAPTLKHRYSFSESASATVIVDSVGGANGTLYPPLGTNQPITLDGSRAHFPGDGDYTVAPYIALPGGLLSGRSDFTLEAWGGYTKEANFMRLFDFGSSQKGDNPHVAGNGIDHVIFAPVWNDAQTRAEVLFSAGADAILGPIGSAISISNEHHIVIVYSPNTGVATLYLDGTNAFSTAPTLLMNQFQDDHGWLGVSQYSDPTLGGWINELRIHEGAFTDQMVKDSFVAGPNTGLVVTPPKLSVALAGSNVQISWPSSAAGFVLKSNTVLTLPFLPVGITPGTNGDNLTVTVPASGSSAFFRLEK
jgi:hypothetical protein